MPVMNGLEATQKIRAIEKEKGVARIPIVALTATTFPAELQAAKESGMDDCLTKWVIACVADIVLMC